MKFDIQAADWDSDKRVQRAKHIAKQIEKAIEFRKGLSAMEFGCGTGLMSFNLKDKFQSITLIDMSQGMIDKLNLKIAEQNVTNMKAFRMDINDESKELGKYDVIYTSMAMHHIIDTKTTVKSLFDLVEDGGCLCIVDLDEEDGSFHSDDAEFTGYNGFNQQELADLLRETGFITVTSETIYNDIKEIGDRKIDYSLFLMKGIK